ncbi:MAG: hypothetical protein ACM3ZE_21015 [Myxococcales bacterium]
MRDTSEPLLAIGAAVDSNQEASQRADSSGSNPTGVTDVSTGIASEAALDPAFQERSQSDTRDLGVDDTPPRPPMKSHSGARLRAATSFDPIAHIFESMRRERRVGLSAGLAGALLLHGAAAAHGYSSLLDLGSFAAAVRSAVVDDVRATYAVEVNKPPPPPPPPEPEPEKPQPQQPRTPAPPQSQAEKPPAPAQAAKVLTADPDPNEPLDLTDQGFVSGEGDRFAGGVTSATGTSKTAVRDLNAQPGGVVGGKGAAPPPPAPKVDLSRPAAPASLAWDCGFPAEADVEQIDFMRVSIVVTVGVDGRAQRVTVLKDPGYGFGNQARQCALRKTYNVGLNADGKPIVTTTPPFIVPLRR